MNIDKISERAVFVDDLLIQIEKRFDFGRFNLNSREKSDHIEIVTDLDISIQKFILSKLGKSFSGEPIIAEEKDNNLKPDSFWVVDPLDGTHNFIGGLPDFGVMIAYCLDNQPVVGGILLPRHSERWLAEKGKGARLNNRIFISKPTSSRHFVFGDSAFRRVSLKYLRLLKKSSEVGFSVRINGCAAWIYTRLASRRGIMISEKTKIWDETAGVLLLRELGAKVTDIQGNNWSTKSKNLLVVHKVENDKEKQFLKILGNYRS